MAGVELPIRIEAVLRLVALYELGARWKGFESPLGQQLEKAERYAKAVTECRRCRGTGQYSKPLDPATFSSDDLAFLCANQLPFEDLISCAKCQGSGRIMRPVVAVRRSAASVWAYIEIKEQGSEPTYEMADPPGLRPLERQVMVALDVLPDVERCALLEYYANRDFETPNPLENLIPLTEKGARRAKKQGISAAFQAVDLLPEAEKLLCSARKSLLGALE